MIDFGLDIYDILISTSGVTGITTNIFPLVAPEATPLPFIVYRRNYDNTYTKDYFSDSTIVLELTVVTLNYSDGVSLAIAIRSAFDAEQIRLISGTELYSEGAYLQSMVFEAKVR